MKQTELRAIEIALDELEAYTGVVGEEDEAHERQQWAIRILHELLERESVSSDAP